MYPALVPAPLFVMMVSGLQEHAGGRPQAIQRIRWVFGTGFATMVLVRPGSARMS